MQKTYETCSSKKKKEGMKMYDATANGADIIWGKISTRCIINVSKEEARQFIRWSDSHFGVWYDGTGTKFLISFLNTYHDKLIKAQNLHIVLYFMCLNIMVEN